MSPGAVREALWQEMVVEAEATHEAVVRGQRRAAKASAIDIAQRAEALALLARTIVLLGKARL